MIAQYVPRPLSYAVAMSLYQIITEGELESLRAAPFIYLFLNTELITVVQLNNVYSRGLRILGRGLADPNDQEYCMLS